MQKVLITGGCGFIGSHLIEKFKEKEFSVRVTDLPNCDFSLAKELGCEIIPSDLLDKESLKKAVQGVDIIIHTAAIFDYGVSYETMEKINVLGVHNICQVACDIGSIKKFVMFSTIGVYGKPERVPAKEEDNKKPRNNYEITKWLGEQAAFKYYKEKGLPVTALRPALVYGPRSKYGDVLYLCIFAGLAARGKKGIKILIKNGPVSHRIHVQDLAEAVYVLTIKEEAIGQVYNVGDENPLSFEELITSMTEVLNLSAGYKIPYIPPIWNLAVFTLRKLTPEFFFKSLNLIIKKIWQIRVKQFNLKKELSPKFDRGWFDYLTGDHYMDITGILSLGWKPKYPDFKTGIKEVIKWYQENKWIP